jgi:hypothetical protein
MFYLNSASAQSEKCIPVADKLGMSFREAKVKRIIDGVRDPGQIIPYKKAWGITQWTVPINGNELVLEFEPNKPSDMRKILISINQICN